MKLALSRKNIWESLPGPVRRSAGAALGLLPPAWILGRSYQRHAAFLRECERWPAGRLRQYQVEQLRRICRLAAETPFYREAFTQVGFDPSQLTDPEQLSVLPTIDKKALREHLPDMCTVSPTSKRIDYVSTGGSSGEPLRFYIGASRSSIEYAYLVSGWSRAGFRPGLPMAVFRGRVVKEDADGLHHEYDPLLKHHYYSSYHLTDERMARFLRHIAGIGPCFLHVYPSSVAALAKFIRRSGNPVPPNIRGILAESEIVYPDQRDMVESVFGVRMFSSYGMTEKLVSAAECEHSRHYHVWPTYGYCELLDSFGNAVTTPGARGEIVGTGFINDVVPFVRYRTGDYATYVGDRCAECGRNHMVITAVEGHRIQETLVAADGAPISWTAVNVHDDTFEHVLRFQFRQEKAGEAMLLVVPGQGFSENDIGRITSLLEAKLKGRLAVKVALVQAIAVSPVGKAIYVDQRIPISAEEG